MSRCKSKDLFISLSRNHPWLRAQERSTTLKSGVCTIGTGPPLSKHSGLISDASWQLLAISFPQPISPVYLDTNLAASTFARHIIQMQLLPASRTLCPSSHYHFLPVWPEPQQREGGGEINNKSLHFLFHVRPSHNSSKQPTQQLYGVGGMGESLWAGKTILHR